MPDKDMLNRIEQGVQEQREEVVRLRRYFHQNPEISFQETNTAAYIDAYLRKIPGLTVSRPTPTSVLAILKGCQDGKVLALRADMDALALQEENDIEYKSANPGVMHACGHDGHAAMLLTAAKIMASLKDRLNGEIRFIFQHAEESHPGGAKDLVKEGIVQGVDMIFAVHLWAALAVGKIGIKSGPFMAAPDNFNISIIGKGGHAAMPQEVIDPIVVSANIISALQTVVSRLNDPFEPLVLSVTQIHGGSTYNIIPEKVELKGTVRTFNTNKRKQLPAMIETIVKGISAAHGADCVFDFEYGYDPVINDDRIVTLAADILERTFGADRIEEMKPVMGGEDFSAYLHHVPGAILFIGAGNAAEGIIQPHHHPCFNIDENALVHGLQVLVTTGLGLLESI